MSRRAHQRKEPGRTAAALMRRGVDLALAQTLSAQRHTLASLQVMAPAALRQLGLSDDAVERIRSSSRPPIPPETLYKLLYDNAYTCCVCRNHARNIIVHHIEDWAISKSHAPENLAVLRQPDHDRAHSKMAHTTNLTAELLRDLKRKWEVEVSTFASSALLDASRLLHGNWAYFNHLRLWEMAKELGVGFSRLSHYPAVKKAGLIEENRDLRPRHTRGHMYNDGNGIVLYGYVKEVMETVLAKTRVVNISDNFERTGLPPLLFAGDVLFVQGAHVFKRETKDRTGPGQAVRGFRQANHVRVEFVIDRYEATSTSAWSLWLSARQSAGTLLRLKSKEHRDGDLVLRGTALGIMNGANGLKSRDYASGDPPESFDEEPDEPADQDFDFEPTDG